MGPITGPIPKRSEDRIRRNVPEVPVEKLEIDAPAAPQPPLNIPDAHFLAIDWYNSLAESAESHYYEPSDWQAARLCAFMMSGMLKSQRPSPEMYKAIQSAFTSLMVTEGDRRRLRLEIVRRKSSDAPSGPESIMHDALAQYQKMFASVDGV